MLPLNQKVTFAVLYIIIHCNKKSHIVLGEINVLLLNKFIIFFLVMVRSSLNVVKRTCPMLWNVFKVYQGMNKKDK